MDPVVFSRQNKSKEDSRHWCNRCDAPCCGICRAENADGSDLDNLRKEVICTTCAGATALAIEDAAGGQDTAPAAPPAALAIVPRTVTPTPDLGPPLPLTIPEEVLRSLSDRDVNFIARTIDLKKKDSLCSSQFKPIKPHNVKKCRRAPIHVTGGYDTWKMCIASLVVFNTMLTQQEQDLELAKKKTTSPICSR